MKKNYKPHLQILISFLVLIIVGTIFLILPFSLTGNGSYHFLDAFFTATSAVTLTGLSTVDVASTYTVFGKIVIGILTQLGGLSITTISFFFLALLGSKIGFVQRDLIKENISFNNRSGIVKNILIIVKITFIIEAIGIILLTGYFKVEGNNFVNSLGMATFHTISAFNNSGLTIFKNSESLMYFNKSIYFNLVSTLLIVVGGMGTIVIHELVTTRFKKPLSIHTKIILKMTLILFSTSFVTFMLFEKDATIIQAIFHSATIRTAGFYTYNYINAQNATIFIMMLMMFIGGAPGSQAGGIKLTTFYTAFKTLIANIKNKEPITNKRKIPAKYQTKAFTIIYLSAIILVISIIGVTLFDEDILLTKILFENISAFSNTGLSLGITSSLTRYSQVILIILMFIGRLGVITFVNAIIINYHKKSSSVDYLDANYII